MKNKDLAFAFVGFVLGLVITLALVVSVGLFTPKYSVVGAETLGSDYLYVVLNTRTGELSAITMDHSGFKHHKSNSRIKAFNEE